MSKRKKRDALVIQNLGLITNIAVRFWKALPASAKAWNDIDDLIQEVTLEVLRKVHRLDGRGRSSTFICTIASNYCRDILDYHNAQCRTGVSMELEDVFCSRDVPLEQLIHVKGAFERILYEASDGLRQSLSSCLEGTWHRRYLPPEQVNELLKLARNHAASSNDFRIIFHQRPN